MKSSPAINENIEAHILTLILAVTLSGCAAGPDFKRPDAPQVDNFTLTPLPAQTASSAVMQGEAQRLMPVAAVDTNWWRALGSAKLTNLIESALEASPTLAAAQAKLRQAEEIHASRAGTSLYPRVDASLNGQRQHASPAAQGQAGDARTFDLYNASLGVHYNVDLSGGTSRALEALAAQADYQRFQLEGARIALAASIATTAIAQARFTAQIEANETILRAQEEQHEIAKERVRLGEASPDDLQALHTQVEQTRAGIPALRTQRDQTAHLLAALSGNPPGKTGLPSFLLSDFTLPADLPVLVPSELVRRRPDIQAAEALLHAANAEYGVAVAKLYPQLTLSASLGSQALSAGNLFGSGSLVWGLVGQLTQPLFNPGLPAEKRAALAAFDAAAANYQGVVLESLRKVADILRAVDNNAQVLAAIAAADESAQASLGSMQRRYGLGAASYLQLLVAQQQAQQSRIGLIAARAQRLTDTVALYQAMGGEISGPRNGF